ncbi:prolyl oligopeptidase family serine peptidase [Streptococcus sp. DD12]|uniref:prolyl oligopeptidase family serine peptidase n=1 Tax=Streptococcus sp. DD12 TaxID=1777880 RepID=UPI00079B164B|nr:PHB depolymerase family esterase [Streptococcus sp. DD12]KXT76987.1 hypothetical protein STRDD12_00121 [Streptococcus sp. DD12]
MKKENATWYSLRKVKGGLASLTLLASFFVGAVTVSADDLATSDAKASSDQEQVLVSDQSDQTLLAQAPSEAQNQSVSGEATGLQGAESQAESSPSFEAKETEKESAAVTATPSDQADENVLLADSKVSADGTVSAVLGAVNQSANLTGFQEGTDGSWYYYGADGQAVTGTQTINGQTLFFAADGKQVKGAFATDAQGQSYFYDADTGDRWTNRFVGVDGQWYYLDASGLKVTGAQLINGQNLYFNADGSQVKGQLANRDGFAYYYAADTGDLVTNSTLVLDGKTYHLNEFGVATTDSDKIATVETTMVLDSYEFGPAVSKVILALNQKVTPDVVHAGSQVILAGSPRKITNSYVSDASGHVIYFDSSSYVTLELEVIYDAKDTSRNATPLSFDLASFSNKWATNYRIDVDDLQLQADSTKDIQWLDSSQDAINHRLYDNTERFSERGSYGRLHYAAYQPDGVTAEDPVPLVVWLHGIGEVGTDVNIPILASNVVRLTQEDLQSSWTSRSGQHKGAHVLVLQSPQAWSANLAADLMAAVQDYVASHPSVDPKRIHLLGASNGGGMVVTMGATYPDYFASLVPIAAPFSAVLDSNKTLTNQGLSNLFNQPMWLLQTSSDQTVVASDNVEPFYKQILQAGASNKWLSLFESNRGSQFPDVTYNGHWSWVRLFNNQVNGVQKPENARTWDGLSGMVATDPTFGGDAKANSQGQSFDSIFAWLNAQVKA